MIPDLLCVGDSLGLSAQQAEAMHHLATHRDVVIEWDDLIAELLGLDEVEQIMRDRLAVDRENFRAAYKRSCGMIPGEGTPGFVEPPGAPFWRQAQAIRHRALQDGFTPDTFQQIESLLVESVRLNDVFYAAKAPAEAPWIDDPDIPTYRHGQPGSDEPVLNSQRSVAEPFQS